MFLLVSQPQQDSFPVLVPVAQFVWKWWCVHKASRRRLLDALIRLRSKKQPSSGVRILRSSSWCSLICSMRGGGKQREAKFTGGETEAPMYFQFHLIILRPHCCSLLSSPWNSISEWERESGWDTCVTYRVLNGQWRPLAIPIRAALPDSTLTALSQVPRTANHFPIPSNTRHV